MAQATPSNMMAYAFSPPGRNPVLLMEAIFARFLPHLPLDAASVAAAADRRNEWLFSGYIPDPGRTDQLLTKMSQECFCTVFKDLDGVYKITADDPDHLPVLHLDHRQDIFEQTLEVQGLPMDQVYTDFYLWYQRVSMQVTSSQAGQYAAVLYVTPDDSISQYAELQTLCTQAAATLATRRRFDFYSDFIADPATADLLLSRFVRQLSIIRREVALQAALPAVPLSITDHVAVHAPLLGQQPFVGEMRRAALAFAAQAPGLALGLTLREAGLMRGAWETWDVGEGGADGFPPAAPRVQETWGAPAPVAEGWFFQSDFAGQTPPVGNLYALRGLSHPLGLGGTQQIYGAGSAWRFTDAQLPSGAWESAMAATPTGQALAFAVAGAATSTPHLYVGIGGAVYALQTSTGDSEALVYGAAGAPQIWSLAAHDFGDGNGTWLYIGTDSGHIYRGHVGGAFVEIHNEGFRRRWRSIAACPVSGQLWAACEDNPFDPEGPYGGNTVRMFRFTAAGPYDVTQALFGGTTNSWGSDLVAFGGLPPAWGGTLVINAGRQDGSQFQMYGLATTVPYWRTVYGLSSLPDQLPGGLAAFDDRLWIGRLSRSGVPVLEVLRSDTAGLNWTLDPYFAEAASGDPNTSVTALAVARGRLYAATGTPYGGPAPGARVYCYPQAEGVTG